MGAPVTGGGLTGLIVRAINDRGWMASRLPGRWWRHGGLRNHSQGAMSSPLISDTLRATVPVAIETPGRRHRAEIALTRARHVMDGASRRIAVALAAAGLVGAAPLVRANPARASTQPINHREKTDCMHPAEAPFAKRWGDIRLRESLGNEVPGDLWACADVRRDRARVGVHGFIEGIGRSHAGARIVSCDVVLKAAVRDANGREREIVNKTITRPAESDHYCLADWGKGFPARRGLHVIVRASGFVNYADGTHHYVAGPRGGWEFTV